MRTGRASQRLVSSAQIDFPQVRSQRCWQCGHPCARNHCCVRGASSRYVESVAVKSEAARLLELSQVPADRVGRRTRYAYAAELGGSLSTAIVKIDLQVCGSGASVLSSCAQYDYKPSQAKPRQAKYFCMHFPMPSQHQHLRSHCTSFNACIWPALSALCTSALRQGRGFRAI